MLKETLSICISFSQGLYKKRSQIDDYFLEFVQSAMK